MVVGRGCGGHQPDGHEIVEGKPELYFNNCTHMTNKVYSPPLGLSTGMVSRLSRGIRENRTGRES